jgi:hypothetical protein
MDSANNGGNMTVTIIVIVVDIVFGFILAIVVTSYYAEKELVQKVATKRQAELDAAGEESKDEETGERD